MHIKSSKRNCQYCDTELPEVILNENTYNQIVCLTCGCTTRLQFFHQDLNLHPSVKEGSEFKP